jgi:hypothetical protein
MTDPDASTDSYRSYDLTSMRERAIRSKRIWPRLDNLDELRWMREGPVTTDQLDTVRRSIHDLDR